MTKYNAIWEGEHFVDGRSFDNLSDATKCCIDVLCGWIDSFRAEHDEHSESFAAEWNEMIHTMSVWVVKASDDLLLDDIVWEPTVEELSRIGWVEFSKL